MVLVSPRNPLNIGAAARAMANLGFTHLVVVAPFAPHWQEAKQSAIGADDVVGRARECTTLAEAIGDCTLVLGTGTLTHRRPEQPAIELPNLNKILSEALSQNGRIALVFGPEKHGLTREALSYCHRLVVIPTEMSQPSMNLGQAVAICLYEIAVHVESFSQPPETPPESSQADSGSLDRVAALIEEVMQRADYSPSVMQEANRHDLRLLLRRLHLKSKDTRRLLGLFRKILVKLDEKEEAGTRRNDKRK